MSSRAAYAALVVALAACSAGDPRGTMDRCEEGVIELELDGAPRVVALPEARSIGTCGRGDPAAELVIHVPLPSLASETLIHARSDIGDALVLIAQTRCGDQTTTFSCVSPAPGGDETQLARPPDSGEVFVVVRSATGRASNVTVRMRTRPLRRADETCDVASAAAGCELDPACPATDRCRDGLACVDGICRSATVGLGERCDGAQRCRSDLACADGVCASPVGLACDLGPTFCSGDFSLVCLDDICRPAIAGEGERCSPRGPTCSDVLVCSGDPGSETCVDVIGVTCEAEVLPVSTVDAPTSPLSFTLDPATPSEHASQCLEGSDTPERVFEIHSASSETLALHVAVTNELGAPGSFHLRGPNGCDQFSGGCMITGEVTLYTNGEPWFVIVEGGGEHTVQALNGVVSAGGGCGTDPHIFCEIGSVCVAGWCRFAIETAGGGACYCTASVLRDPAIAITRMRGVLRPGEEQWFQFLSSSALGSLRFFAPAECPPDLEVEIFRGGSLCAMGCDPDTVLEELASGALADGTSCTSTDIATPSEAGAELRFRVTSATGGPFDVSFTGLP